MTSMKPCKPFNRYNVFFILERALLIDAKRSGSDDETASCRPSSPSNTNVASAAPLTGYEDLVGIIPPLPPRYQHLTNTLQANWYDPGRKKFFKRKHTKSHGLISFRDIAKSIADTWKIIDPITRDYTEAVALILKTRHQELLDLHSSLSQQPRTVSPSANDTVLTQQQQQQKEGKQVTKKQQRQDAVDNCKPAWNGQFKMMSRTMNTVLSTMSNSSVEPLPFSFGANTKHSVLTQASLKSCYLCTVDSFPDIHVDTFGLESSTKIDPVFIPSEAEFTMFKSLTTSCMNVEKSCPEVDVTDLEILSFWDSA